MDTVVTKASFWNFLIYMPSPDSSGILLLFVPVLGNKQEKIQADSRRLLQKIIRIETQKQRPHNEKLPNYVGINLRKFVNIPPN